MVCENIGVNDLGHLTFAGQDTAELAKQYGTPAYLMDEDRIRYNCRLYMDAMKDAMGEGSYPLFASKAACFKRIYEIMAEEGMAIDLVSPGEVYTAMKANFPMERSFFHGNNKTDEDIAFAMDAGVGYFVVDSLFELDAVQAEAEKRGIVQNVLLRLTPGIDPHTYEAVATGKVDSKFGVAIETGQAEVFVASAAMCDHVKVCGYHCHVGSQVFDEEGSVYTDAAKIMFAFMAEMNEKYYLNADLLNMGGGYGVRYVESDPYVDIPANIRKVAEFVKNLAAELNVPAPKILMEPGRSIVADAGMTLYTVGTVKKIPGYKNYASIDGGMTDNPRYALYEAPYTVYNATAVEGEDTIRCDLVGRCCESGDVLQPNVTLPIPERGDTVAMCTTGAYNYSMASNYNRICRPPVVMLRGGDDYVAVRRETLKDLMLNDL